MCSSNWHRVPWHPRGFLQIVQEKRELITLLFPDLDLLSAGYLNTDQPENTPANEESFKVSPTSITRGKKGNPNLTVMLDHKV